MHSIAVLCQKCELLSWVKTEASEDLLDLLILWWKILFLVSTKFLAGQRLGSAQDWTHTAPIFVQFGRHGGRNLNFGQLFRPSFRTKFSSALARKCVCRRNFAWIFFSPSSTGIIMAERSAPTQLSPFASALKFELSVKTTFQMQLWTELSKFYDDRKDKERFADKTLCVLT